MGKRYGWGEEPRPHCADLAHWQYVEEPVVGSNFIKMGVLAWIAF